MQAKIVSKNDVRSALIDLHYGLIRVLQGPENKTSVQTFRKDMNKLCSHIRTKYSKSADRKLVYNALRNVLGDMMSVAKELSIEGQFTNGTVLYSIFDGIPLTREPAEHKSYDLVIKLDSTRTKAWVFAPNSADNYDPINARVQAEQDYQIPCIDTTVINQIAESAFAVGKQSTKRAKGSKQSEKQKTRVQKSKPQILGRVLFSKKDQFILRAEQHRDQIHGYIFEEFQSFVKPLDILVLENADLSKKIYAKVSKIGVNPLSGGGYVRQFSEIATHVIFTPLMESSEDWRGRVRPSNLMQYIIRRPTSKELNEVLSIPERGMPIGNLDYDGSTEVFKFPLIPEDTVYQSILVAGVQGKGKSNFLKLFIRALVTLRDIPPAKRPAVIILDREGEYTEFVRRSSMNPSSTEFLEKYGIGDLEPRIFTVNSDPSKSDCSLSLRGIDREALIYLLPELESKTENILRVLMNRVSRQLDEEQAPQDIETLRNRLLMENNNSQLIHLQQRPAIARAILSQSLNLLDQKGKTPLTPQLLFRPGSVSVINYKGMDQNMKRVVALYLLEMLDKHKMNEPNADPGVLLVIDEAEILFPESPSKADKDYVLRIEARMQDITNRGRKHRYGVVLVTHSPAAVSKQVGDLANTKVAFACSGSDKWIRDYFGKDHVNEINSFPTGVCRISVKINTSNQGPINARVKIPYVGDGHVLSDMGFTKS